MIKSLKNGAYQYSEADFLGEGSFAKVYKGVIAKNNRVIAVRILPLKLIKQYGDKMKQIIGGQVQVLKELSNSDSIDYIFTTRIYDCFLTENNVTMILEYCPDGNLQDIINKKGGSVPEQEAIEIMYQIARGIQFIAREKVVHRDIKPDNIFVKKQKHHTLFKLGDFGFAVKKQINQEIVGTPIFMSPEIFREEAYGSEVDVWAFGLMCHYMLFKEYYFIGASQKQIKKKVLKQPYKLKPHHLNKISQEMAGFLSGCLEMDKNKRLRATELSKHKLFNSVRDKVNVMVQQIKHTNSVLQSQIIGQSAKGKVAKLIMSYQFMFDLAGAISQRDNSSLTSLFMIKHNLGELNYIRGEMRSKSNFLHLPDWQEFADSKSYNQTMMILQATFFAHQKCFEGQYNRLLQGYSSQGQQVIQHIRKNLGDGPLARIPPTIIIPDLTQNWINRLKGENSPEGYVRSLQCIVTYALYQNKNVEIDFVNLEMNKGSISLQEKAHIIENALKLLK